MEKKIYLVTYVDYDRRKEVYVIASDVNDVEDKIKDVCDDPVIKSVELLGKQEYFNDKVFIIED